MLDSYIVAGWFILAWPTFWLWIGSKLASKNFATMLAVSLASLLGFAIGMTMLSNLIPQTINFQLSKVYENPGMQIFSVQAVTGYSFWHYIVLAIPWLILAFVIARLALGLYILRSRTRGYGNIDRNSQKHFDKIAKLLGINPVKVFVGSDRPVAFSDHTGVYIGRPILQSLPKEDVDAIIAHEYSHIRRKDVPSRWLWVLMSSLAFIMPSKSLTRSYLFEVEKNADKEAVTALGSPLPLAQALVSVARISTPAAANFTGSDVTQRALALLEPPKERRNTSLYKKIALTFCLSLLLPVFTWPQPVLPKLNGMTEEDMHKLVEGKTLAVVTPSITSPKTVNVKFYSSDALKQLPDGRLILDRRHIIGTL
ncbi:MAG: M48 family metalloprotease [Caldisericia bacterium]|nr:M48 family metalloprotease [Caldisericia bacterium]